MADPARARKLADRIKVIVAETLEHRIKDPRLGFVTITDTRVTGDLQQASIYYTVLGEEADRESTAAALESAKGVIRSEVGKQTGIRLTPSIAFFQDALPENSEAFEELLAKAKQRDEEIAARAAAAQYAGEADPYRHLDEADDPALDEDSKDEPDAEQAPA